MLIRSSARKLQPDCFCRQINIRYLYLLHTQEIRFALSKAAVVLTKAFVNFIWNSVKPPIQVIYSRRKKGTLAGPGQQNA